MPCDPSEVITPEDMEGFVDNVNLINDVVESSESTLTTPDGEEIYTLRGQLARLGFLPPVDYAASISFTINDAAKTIDRNGIIYAPFPSSLPFVTSGTWVGDDDEDFYVVQTDLNVTNDKLGEIFARMANGEAVSIGFFGDSTTDGNNTTGWTANPVDGGGNAIGTTDHNLAAPNAYPAVIQTLLREIYDNSSIDTYNAGYQGRRIEDGWAVANYDTAMVNNPEYGVPDICCIQFGINDVQGTGDAIGRFISESRILINQIIDDGTVPVLISCDPVWQNGALGPNTIDQKKVRREMDQAKTMLAKEFGIPFWDVGSLMLNWVQDNNDGYAWMQEQPDSLHFGDNGHKFKSSAFASFMYNDYLLFDGGDEYLNSISSQASFVSDSGITTFDFTNNKQGGNILFNSGAPAGTDVFTGWVWNTCPNAHLHYLGITNENVTAPDTLPTISVNGRVSGVTTSKDLNSAGTSGAAAGYGYSDDTHYFDRLEYGLNKITYTLGDSTSAFWGGFRITESSKHLGFNCLKDAGAPYTRYMQAAGSKVIDPLPETCCLSNVLPGVLGSEEWSIEFDVTLIQDTGLIFSHGQGFQGVASSVTNNDQVAYLLLRNTSTDFIDIFAVRYSGNDLSFQNATLLGTTVSAPAWTNDNFEGRITLRKDNGTDEQVFELYDDPNGISAPILTITLSSSSFRWGGVCGGLWGSTDAGGFVDGLSSINRLIIRR